MSDDRTVPVQARLRSREISVGELAQLTGARPSAIRYYETCGLLPVPARRSGRRRYDQAAVERMKAILNARRLGFSIAELKKLASKSTDDWQREAQSKALSLRERIVKLSADAEQLDELSGCDCQSGGSCRL